MADTTWWVCTLQVGFERFPDEAAFAQYLRDRLADDGVTIVPYTLGALREQRQAYECAERVITRRLATAHAAELLTMRDQAKLDAIVAVLGFAADRQPRFVAWRFLWWSYRRWWSARPWRTRVVGNARAIRARWSL